MTVDYFCTLNYNEKISSCTSQSYKTSKTAENQILYCFHRLIINFWYQRGELVLADGIVEIVDLFEGTAVIPQNRRADDVIGCIQRDEAVHLAAGADTHHLRSIKVLQ